MNTQRFPRIVFRRDAIYGIRPGCIVDAAGRHEWRPYEGNAVTASANVF
jgi:hypothetical protein